MRISQEHTGPSGNTFECSCWTGRSRMRYYQCKPADIPPQIIHWVHPDPRILRHLENLLPSSMSRLCRLSPWCQELEGKGQWEWSGRTLIEKVKNFIEKQLNYYGNWRISSKNYRITKVLGGGEAEVRYCCSLFQKAITLRSVFEGTIAQVRQIAATLWSH